MLFSAHWTILTAAHCFKEDETLIVYAGIVDMRAFTDPGGSGQAVIVKDGRKHINASKRQYDVAVLLLSSPLKFNGKLYLQYQFHIGRHFGLL